VGNNPGGVAVTKDGKHAYITNPATNTVSVIDTATNTVEAAKIPVGTSPRGVGVAPDWKHAYVANVISNNVSVIDTATNTVVGTPIPVGDSPSLVAVAPDGKHAYVTNLASNNVSVIDTASATVAATVPVGSNPVGVGMFRRRWRVQFLAFSANLEIDLDRAPQEDRVDLQSTFILSSTHRAAGSILSPRRSRSVLAPLPAPSRPAPSKRTMGFRGDRLREPGSADQAHG
jgi:YVTN family beta-propeller protein